MSIAARVYDQLDWVDKLPGGLRACVHEYGYPIVYTLVKHGIRNPAHIHEIVREVWAGARAVPQRSKVPFSLKQVDWILSQSGCEANVKTLWRTLVGGNYTIVPVYPTRMMLDASLREVTGGNVVVSKEEKHRRRYVAAVKAYVDQVGIEIEAAA